MMWDDFVGNRRIIDFFSAAVQQKTLFDGAYLLVGPTEVGKRTCALLVAAALLGTSYEKIGLHPDFVLVERLVDEKSGKRKRDITVEQARDLKRRLSTSSWGARARVVVVDGADTLNEEASNALLKMLEEPSGRSYFFLIVEHEERVMPTVRSRSHIVHFGLVSGEECRRGFGERFTKTSIEPYVSYGRPGRIVRILEDESERAIDERYRAWWQLLNKEPWYVQSRAIEEWLGKGEQATLDRDELDGLLVSWILEEYARFRSENRDEPEERRRVFACFEALSKARMLIRHQVQPRLVFEQCAEHVRVY